MSASNQSTDNPTAANPAQVVVRGSARNFLQEATAGEHHLRIDEPVSVGGSGAAPDPYDYLLTALGACTSMTVGLYARRQKWPLENITVWLRHSRVHAKDCEDCLTKDGLIHQLDLQLDLTGSLTKEQHAKLMEVAAKCPVHKTLTSEIKIRIVAGAQKPAP